MRKRLKVALAASFGVAALAVAGATVTTANFTPFDGIDSAIIADDPDAVIDQDGAPTPVAGNDLFVTVAGDVAAVCMSLDNVVARLKVEERAFGGKTVTLAGGIEQAFADTWRREARVASVPVSAIAAHIFSDPSGTDWTADVVEFDRSGCAMSRTLVPGEVWNTLITAAMGRAA